MARQDFDGALARAQSAARLNPKEPRAFVTLGVLFQLMHQPVQADAAFSAALKMAPAEVPALYGLGVTKAEAGEFDEAERLLRRLLQIDPTHFQAKIILARTLRDLGEFEDSEERSKQTITEHPTEAKAYSALGIQLQEMGRFAEARELFRKAIELDPNHGFAYWGTVQGTRITEQDRPILEKIESILASQMLPDMERVDLLAGLGKGHNDLGEYGKAMEYFSASNRLANQLLGVSVGFSKERYTRYFDEMPRIFTRDFIAAHQTREEARPKPIFIVGMIRSGTTLVEQILSSHPRVTGGNEIRFWVGEIGACMDLEQHTFDFQRAISARKKYNKLIRRIGPDSDFVTDKMPDNFKVLGPLHMLYPDVKIVHCRRNPVDTCLSILMTPFRKPPDFSRDPEKLVFMYREYERTMNHWRETLPSSSLLDVDYEELVADTEAVTRRIVDFCGLEWNDACLRPQDNKRTVVTASVWQVRQPVYRTSLERWRNYEPWLGPLRELLNQQ